MFAFDRSAVAVLLPLALLLAVVLWSNQSDSVAAMHQASAATGLEDETAPPPAAAPRHQTVAANLPSK